MSCSYVLFSSILHVNICMHYKNMFIIEKFLFFLSNMYVCMYSIHNEIKSNVNEQKIQISFIELKSIESAFVLLLLLLLMIIMMIVRKAVHLYQDNHVSIDVMDQIHISMSCNIHIWIDNHMKECAYMNECE